MEMEFVLDGDGILCCGVELFMKKGPQKRRALELPFPAVEMKRGCAAAAALDNMLVQRDEEREGSYTKLSNSNYPKDVRRQ